MALLHRSKPTYIQPMALLHNPPTFSRDKSAPQCYTDTLSSSYIPVRSPRLDPRRYTLYRRAGAVPQLSPRPSPRHVPHPTISLGYGSLISFVFVSFSACDDRSTCSLLCVSDPVCGNLTPVRGAGDGGRAVLDAGSKAIDYGSGPPLIVRHSPIRAMMPTSGR
eukprot:3355224-Rhodomonas_salina.1